jgi:hypothetical protein
MGEAQASPQNARAGGEQALSGGLGPSGSADCDAHVCTVCLPRDILCTCRQGTHHSTHMSVMLHHALTQA